MSTDTPRTKIALLITKSNWGGAQKNVYDIATHLDPKKYEVVVILGGHGLLKKKLSEVGIRTISMDNLERDISIKKEIKNFIELYSILKQEKPAVLHLHSTKAGGIGAFIGRLRGIKKIVYTVHGWPFNEDRSVLQKLIIIFFSWLSVILSTDVINISKKDTEQTQLFPLIEKRSAYIPNGIREQSALRELQAREFFEQRIGMSLKGKFIVGMIGELHKNKGYTYAIQGMVEVVKNNPNAILLIISSGELQEMLQRMIDQLNLKTHIFLLGFIENAPQYAKAFDVFLMSSIKEGLPYVLLEVGILGVPLIATTVGGIPEIIDDMRSGILIQPAKAQEIAYAVTFMHEHPEIRTEYGNAIARKVKADFGLQKMIQSIEKTYTIAAPKTRAA